MRGNPTLKQESEDRVLKQGGRGGKKRINASRVKLSHRGRPFKTPSSSHRGGGGGITLTTGAAEELLPLNSWVGQI